MKQKLTLLILALVMSMGAWADTTITFSSDQIKNGGSNPATFYDGNGNVVTGSAWCRKFITNTSIPITFTVGSLDRFSSYSGGFNTNGNLWITATVPAQYTFTGVSFKAKIIDGGSKQVYVEGNTDGRVTLTDSYQTVSSGALSSNSVRFRFENGNDGTNAGECIVVFEDFEFTINTELADAASSITNNHFYRIFTYNNGSADGTQKYYLTASGTFTDQVASAGEFTFSATTADHFVPTGYAWMITADGGTKYFTNPSGGEWNNRLNEKICTTTQKRQNWEAQVFYLNNVNKYAVRCTNAGIDTSWKSHAYWTVVPDDDDEDNLPDPEYSSERNYIWEIEEIASVTFNLIYNGNTIDSKVLDRASNIGDVVLPTEWDNPYCTYSYSTTTINANTETVNVTMTWNGPFEFSSDYASAKWYYLALRKKWAKYDKDLEINSSTAYPLYSDKSEVACKEEGLWAFVGNPLGVRVFNKAAGNDVCLQWTTQPQIASTSNSNAVYWKIGKCIDNSSVEHGFLLYYQGVYLHDLGGNNPGKLAVWSSGSAPSDPGSAFIVEEPNFKDLVIQNIKPWFDTMGQYFSLNADIVYANNTYAPALENCSPSTYDELLAYVSDASHYHYPSSGYYRIKNKVDGYGYMGVSNNQLVGNISQSNAISDPSTIIYIEKNGNTAVKLSTQGKYGQVAAGGYAVSLADASPASYFTLEVQYPGYAMIRTSSADNGSYYTVYNGEVSAWTSDTPDANWKFEVAESVTITLNDGGDGYYYATACLPYDVTLSTACAYTLTLNGAKNGLTMSDAMSVVPAGTPIFLRHTEGTVVATIASNAAYVTSPLTTTALTGTYLDKPVTTKTDYFLGKANDKVGFYLWDGTTLKANRAYLEASKLNNSGVKGFALDFEDDATSIQTIDNGQQTTEGAIYNVAGQRMNKMQKGINIINGKKILK